MSSLNTKYVQVILSDGLGEALQNIYHEHILYTFLSGVVYQHFSQQRSLRVNANIEQQRGSAGQASLAQ